MEFLLKFIIFFFHIYDFLLCVLGNSCIFLFHFFISLIKKCFFIFFHSSLPFLIICHFGNVFVPDGDSIVLLVSSDCLGVSDSLGSIFLHSFYFKLFLHNRSFVSSIGIILHISELIFDCSWVKIALEIRTVLSISFLSPETTSSCSTHLTFIIRRLPNSNTSTHLTSSIKLLLKISLIIFLANQFVQVSLLFYSIIGMCSLYFILFDSLLIQLLNINFLSSFGVNSFFVFDLTSFFISKLLVF